MATVAENVKQDPKLDRAKRLIRSLMERTEERGCSEAEALEAAYKIGELLAQFNLTMDEVELRETKMVQAEVYAADRAAQGIVTGIGKLCSLKTYCKGGQTVSTFVMYGYPEDILLGQYLYEVCAEALDADWAKDMVVNGYSKKARESFRAGFAARLYQRMADLREQRDAEEAARNSATGTALVLLKNQIVEAEFEKTGVKLSYSKKVIHDRDAYGRGSEAGKRVNINSPLTNARAGQGAIR